MRVWLPLWLGLGVQAVEYLGLCQVFVLIEVLLEGQQHIRLVRVVDLLRELVFVLHLQLFRLLPERLVLGFLFCIRELAAGVEHVVVAKASHATKLFIALRIGFYTLSCNQELSVLLAREVGSGWFCDWLLIGVSHDLVEVGTLHHVHRRLLETGS